MKKLCVSALFFSYCELTYPFAKIFLLVFSCIHFTGFNVR